jgi:hypothetical protein
MGKFDPQRQRSAPKSATVSVVSQAMWAGSQRWMKVPKPDSFATTLGGGKLGHGGAPCRAARRRWCLQHARMLQHEGHTRAGVGQRSARHLPAKTCRSKRAVVGQPRDVALHGRVAAEVGPAAKR